MEKMNKKGIFNIGGNGLVGSRISELLSPQYSVINVGPTQGVDITDSESVLQAIKQTNFENIVLLAAKADVDGCEEDKELGEEGEAWKINVEGTKNVVEACRQFSKKLFYISTDFVFNGEKEIGEQYSEIDSPNPINWYAKTKYEGEKILQEKSENYCIIRIAYPYRSAFEQKKDFMRAIKGRLEQNLPVKAITDHYFTPTFIDDFVFALASLIEHDASGLYHVVGSQTLSPYDAALHIAETFNFDKNLISGTTRQEFFAGKAERPFNLSLNNAKITELGVKMKTFEEGLEEIKKQL